MGAKRRSNERVLLRVRSKESYIILNARGVGSGALIRMLEAISITDACPYITIESSLTSSSTSTKKMLFFA